LRVYASAPQHFDPVRITHAYDRQMQGCQAASSVSWCKPWHPTNGWATPLQIHQELCCVQNSALNL